MDNQLFQKFVRFITAVHENSKEMTKGIQLESVTPVQYRILEYIYVSEPVTISQISECIDMSMPNMSRELKKLTEKQLCEKITDVHDRRKQYISLSEKGRGMMDQAFREIEVRFMGLMGSLTEEERAEVERALEVLQSKVFR
ncbi:MarR family winged helix-turn-helix transcriptional regulator [Brevibacillus dissolubilis]|uniref:MarR family winged helix-turn-helix transcriptional regulator n=1 Tax=Brevibacillus dissolubilis TaxID=1844116 RepID=UPI0034CD9FD5